MAGAGWVVSPAGLSRVPRVVPCARGSPTASGAMARCARRSPATPGWPPLVASVWRGALPALAHGPLAPELCPRPPEVRAGPDPLWSAPAPRLPGRGNAPPWPPRAGRLAHDRQWPCQLAPGRHRSRQGGGFDPVVSRGSMCGLPAGAVVSGPRQPDRWLRQHQQQFADMVSWDAPGPRLAPCGHHAPRDTAGDRLPGAPGLTLAVPHAVAPGMPAPGAAGVCTGATAPPLGRPRGAQSRDGQRGAGTALVPSEEGGLVGGPCRPPDAGDQHLSRPSPQRHRAEVMRDAGVPSSKWSPTGMAQGTCTVVPPHPRSASSPARRAMWGRRGKRTSTHRRLVPQSADPHLRRLPLSGDTLHH